ncbi:MAG TPA: hypothetical protein VIM42_06665 [Clostridium sp.]
MSLLWGDIRNRSIEFSNEWRNETKENAEAKTFWDDFFSIFGNTNPLDPSIKILCILNFLSPKL